MQIETLLKQHPIFTQAEVIKTLCQPLHLLGITYFAHVHIDEKKCLTALSNHPQYAKLYLSKGYYQYDLHMKEPDNAENYVLWDLIERTGKSAELHREFLQFSCDHTFSFVYKTNNTMDCFHFAATPGNPAINQHYLQSLEALKRFVQYFQNSVTEDKLLLDAYSMPIALLPQQGKFMTDDPVYFAENHCFDQMIQNKASIFRRQMAGLTAREMQCLHWVSQGKTLDETALILNITLRTVKAHIKNAKTKLGCRNLFQLGMAYAEL